ncbi:hypothetical protein GCK32_003075 [Trichostrongylus colubriformis]|uniref:SH2 domain-containing protein n=1 Tax=Trichostrongylus colubriformis TaxID=6319 RepID=A0AAN8FLV5_TRICO
MSSPCLEKKEVKVSLSPARGSDEKKEQEKMNPERPALAQLQAGQLKEKLEMGHFDEEYELMLANLEKEDWYHGCLPLDDILTQLKKNGDFLLRLAHGEGGKSSTVRGSM